MNVGILGLGLIGGSMARAYALEGHTVYATQRNEQMLQFAMMTGAVHGRLDEETMDGAGIKREICEACFPLAEKYGFTFVGGHPMAGSQFSGFKYSRATLFKGQPMVLVPPRFDDINLLERCKKALEPLGFGRFSVTTADDHDRMIAFTSQMPHILSNAFIKSPTAGSHKGFSAGSYKDMTRVAWLNAPMWAELCMENKDHVLYELNYYLESLTAYRDALESGDLDTLTALLEEGKRRKEEVDG